ncbi:alpha/beta hydrolase [Kordiimonas pumila]|uniref:Platelet-activating factor acetylhydrolase n=1 Tax=Kordiimonas pumila TaxID=2161677 RepID=A0ABV7D4W0_9PROT|nr:hypothetical protein [Kordiimonas pumila]
MFSIRLFSIVFCISGALGTFSARGFEVHEAAAEVPWPQHIGPYATGTRIEDWRHVFEDGSEVRFKMQLWYPASVNTTACKRAPYFQSIENKRIIEKIGKMFGFQSDVLKPLTRLQTNSCQDAPILMGKAFPLVIFSHGYWMYLQQNTALMEMLASSGYLAVSIAHSGDSLPVFLADGTVIDTVPYEGDGASSAEEAFWNGSDHAARTAAYLGFMEAIKDQRITHSLHIWQRDIVAVLDDLESGVSGAFLNDSIDFEKVAFAGMSFGGATSAAACHHELRCKAAINLDGFQYDARLYDTEMRTPFLLMNKDWVLYDADESPQSPDFNASDYFYEPLTMAGNIPDIYRVRVRLTRHIDFTDLALIKDIGATGDIFGDLAGPLTLESVNRAVLAFLDHYVRQKDNGFPEKTLRHYPGLVLRDAGAVARWKASQ